MDAKSAIQIGLVVVVLFSFVVVYLSGKTWQWPHVVLVLLIFLASGVFWYLSAAVLKAHQSYRNVANKLEAEIHRLDAQNAAMRLGTKDEEVAKALAAEQIRVGANLRDVRHDLGNLKVDRGYVWYDVQADAGQIGADGTVTVSIEHPNPHLLDAGMILYLFQQGSIADQASYVGEFIVTAAGEGTATLKPTMKLRPDEIQRLRQPVDWTMYMVMPVDRHDLFAGLGEDYLKAIFPPQSVEEYLRDGTEAQADDAPERIAGYKSDGKPAKQDEQDRVVERRYVRMLRDYKNLFRILRGQLVIDQNRLEQTRIDTAHLDGSLKNLEADVALREQEKTKLASDLARFKKELEIVSEHFAVVSRQFENLTAILKATADRNRELASELAKRQFELAKKIEAQTGGSARARGASVLELEIVAP